MSLPRFPLGRVLATPGALEALERTGDNPAPLLRRHVAGDFGEMDEHDETVNLRAISNGERVLSHYRLTDGTRLYIITEADRSVTTLLLPDEY